MIQSDTIHLCRHVPSKGRAKSLCGAVLRKGFLFNSVERYLTALQHRMFQTVYFRGNSGNSLKFYGGKLECVCKSCLDTEEYAMAVLANLP